MADWLQSCGVKTVAMQSTGVYWIPLFEILEARGFEVYLVNARHTKNLPGRKSDVQESQWLLKLHTYGLLSNSFHPTAQIRVLRTYWRQRGDHIQAISMCIQRLAAEPPKADSPAQEPTPKASRTTKRNKKAQGHAPDFNLGTELQRISGVDLTRIDGIDVVVAQTIISEVGLDMNRWKTEAHFASWLGLCPDNRISGDKVLGKGTRHVVNRAATALRMAATTLLKSKSYLGAQYRRLRTKLGAPKAITAMAHKLARLVYRMLKYGQEYLDKGMQYYDERYRKQQIDLLKKKATNLGLQIVETPAA